MALGPSLHVMGSAQLPLEANGKPLHVERLPYEVVPEASEAAATAAALVHT